MTDIVSITNDLGLFNTQTPKAGNILSVQLANLEYAPELGIDLRYFLSEEFRFENESFKAYLIERLANSSINVTSVIDLVETLYTKYTFYIGNDENNNGLVAG